MAKKKKQLGGYVYPVNYVPQKKDGGWLDEFEEGGSVESHMGGLTDQGFDYNGAWGGPSMQMGGTMPGSVGFTYARTINPAPSKGPYAKKTMASAQNGKEMSFYQNGLDWTPKNISRDGSEIPNAQVGILATPQRAVSDATRVVPKAIPLTENEKKEAVKRSADLEKKAVEKENKIVAERKKKANTKGDINVPGSFNAAEKFRLFPESGGGAGQVFDEYVNPLYFLGSMADNLGESVARRDPSGFAKSVALTAGAGALGFDPLGAIYKKLGSNEAVKNFLKTTKGVSKSENIKEAIGVLSGIPAKKTLPRLSSKGVADLRQIQELSRLKDLGRSNSELMRHALENNVSDANFERFFNRTRSEGQSLLDSGFGEIEAQQLRNIRSGSNQTFNSENQLAPPPEELILDINDFDDVVTPGISNQPDITSIPQPPRVDREELINNIYDYRHVHNVRPSEKTMRQILDEQQFAQAEANPRGRSIRTDQLSDDQLQQLRDHLMDRYENPSLSTKIQQKVSPKIKEIKQKIDSKLNNVSSNEGFKKFIVANSQNYPYYTGYVKEKVPSLFLSGNDLKSVSRKVGIAPEGVTSGQVFTGSTNTSHSSYLPQLKQIFRYKQGDPQFLGYQPMNSLGYLSRAGVGNEEIAAYLNSEIDEQIKRGIIPKDIQRPYFKPNGNYGEVLLPHYGVKQHREGGEIPQAQIGIKQRAASDNTSVRAPRTDMMTADESRMAADESRFWNIIDNQPVIQSPGRKQLTKDEIFAKNEQYARETGKKFNPKTGEVSPAFSPSVGKKLDKLNESVLNAATYALDVPVKIVQSAYKPDYTFKDAIIGKPTNSSFLEDIFTDPEMIATLGLKGLLKGGLKTALGKGFLSSAALPFYKSTPADPDRISAFVSKLNEAKDLVTTPKARQAFKDVSDFITRNPKISDLDQDYVNAITNPDLPVNAIDKYANLLTSIDAGQNALNADQVKYLNNVGSLKTTYKTIDTSVPVKDRLNFVIDNSKNISPRDILPYVMENQRSISNDETRELLEKLYGSYSGRAVANPMAEYSAATDLFSLADTYDGSRLQGDLYGKLGDIDNLSLGARPHVSINPDYFDDAYNQDYANEAIHMLARSYNPQQGGYSRYQSIPKQQELLRDMRASGKQVVETMNDIFTNPANKGKFYVGARNLSTDSYPLTLSMFARNKNLLDFRPINRGSMHSIGSTTNDLGGLSNYIDQRGDYLRGLKDRFDRALGGTNSGNASGLYRPFDSFQKQMMESSLISHHIDKFNKEIGTNIPSQYKAGWDGTRPNIGAIIKKKGGKVKKDDMGYWNPENWGEPVEIGSNEITMQGVYEPLLGISDTGDVQMMYPGEEYEFDGESVTEYPVMQKGGRTPIYTDNPNDPRLKAFKDSASVYNDFLRLKKMMDSKYSSNKDYYVKKEDYPRNPDGSICYNCIKKEAERKKAKEQFYSKGFNQGFTQLVDPNIDPRGYVNYLKDNPVFDESVGKFQDYSNARPKQPVYYKKPESKKSKTNEDHIIERMEDNKGKKPIYVSNPNDPRLKAYQDSVSKWNIVEKEYIQQRGKSVPSDVIGDWDQERGYTYRPLQPVKYKKPAPKPTTSNQKPQSKPQPVIQKEQPKPVERKQNVYEGTPVYSSNVGSGMPSAVIGFANQRGDTTYIKPEDYERFGVPKYGKEYIESKTTNKKKNGGWLDEFE